MTELRYKECTFPNDHGGVCGWTVVYVDSGTETHAGRIVCQRCDRMRKWLSHEQYETIKTFQCEIARLMPHELAVLTDQSLTIGTKTVSFEAKQDTGSLFRNEKKKTDNSPDYTGDGNVGGVKVRMSGWIKDKKGGGKYLSLSFKPKEEEKADF